MTGGHLGPAGWPSARDDHGRQTFNGPSEPMGYRRVRMMRRCERLTFADGFLSVVHVVQAPEGGE